MVIHPISSNALDDCGHGYPRPQLRRDSWFSLNGVWEFAFDDEGSWKQPSDVEWTREIVVPFAPEAPASGIGRTDFLRVCWYRSECAIEPPAGEERWLLHCGAVDFAATVWINGVSVGGHQGGYTPFGFDITDGLLGPVCEIVIRAEETQDLAKPRGKQDWQLEAHSIWYSRTTGIWQTVWLERVPSTSNRSSECRPNGRRRLSVTTATRALLPGCRSTNPGACRIFQANPASVTTYRRCIT